MTDERSVPISALQHYVYCPRQCALIHTEREWAENALTFLGRSEHKRVESALSSNRGRIRETRSIQLVSDRLRIHGVSDVVEYEQIGNELRVTPVEYKHGKPKVHDADKVQLCAQALCLEEMHGCHIEYGYLFYHAIRHREKIEFNDEIRAITLSVISETQKLLESGKLPPAIKRKDCAACSLIDICLPLSFTMTAASYNDKMFGTFLSDEATS